VAHSAYGEATIPASRLQSRPAVHRASWDKPHVVTPGLGTTAMAPGTAAVEEDREDQDAAISASRTSVRRAISGPLTSVASGLSR
jgi:hypothetical protein